MSMNFDIFGPETEEDKAAYSIEDLVFSVQLALQRSMQKQGVSQKQLAERLGMSPARISQVFSCKGPNLTLKTIGKIQHALGESFELVRKDELEALRRKNNVANFKRTAPTVKTHWRETVSSNLYLVKQNAA